MKNDAKPIESTAAEDEPVAGASQEIEEPSTSHLETEGTKQVISKILTN